MTDSEDDILLQRATTGDRAAFNGLVRRHQQRVVQLACRLLGGDTARAEDVAQEAFLRLWGAAPGYVAQGNFTAYLFRIVRNLCCDIRRHIRPVASLDTISHHATDDNALRERRAIYTAVQMALAELPDAQREVFILSHYEGLSYQEIADLLGCPPGTVASRKYHATLALRQRLAKELGIESKKDEG